MARDEVVETIYGKYSKFEVIKKSSTLGNPRFHLYKDGRPHRGPFSDLRDAVSAAEAEG